jgi:hypothetical protein
MNNDGDDTSIQPGPARSAINPRIPWRPAAQETNLVRPDEFWRDKIVLPEERGNIRDFLLVFSAGLIGGMAGGLIGPSILIGPNFDRYCGFLFLTTILGGGLGLMLGTITGALTIALCPDGRDHVHNYRVRCGMAAGTFCVTAVLAGWAMIELLVAAWASC